MTTEEMVTLRPQVDYGALENEILSTVLFDDNYLFYRTGTAFDKWQGWLGVGDEDTSEQWEMYCTACGAVSYEKKRRGTRVSRLTACPACGALIRPKRWIYRTNLQTCILYYKFVRGQGRDIWLYAYHVTHDFCPYPEDTRVEFEIASVYRFADGEAEKWEAYRQVSGWTAEPQYFRQPNAWKKRKSITKTVWYINTAMSLETYPAYIGVIGRGTIAGSCLEYSQLDKAIAIDLDIPEYLALYCKYPAVEYLWKMGVYHFLEDKIMRGNNNAFQQAVNLRAKTPGQLLRGLTKQEIRYIADQKPDCRDVVQYHRLREAGVISCDKAGWDWSKAIAGHETVLERCTARGMGHKELRRYIEQQAKKRNIPLNMALHDYQDYLSQNIDVLGADAFALAPHDLQEAHERLSRRLRRAAGKKNLPAFRIRRRELGWMRFARGDILIRPIDSPMELVAEGEQQHNCVAGYEGRHAQGKTAVFVMRRRSAPHKSWHTVELDERSLVIKQIRAAHNMEAEPEAKAFAQAWTAHLRQLVDAVPDRSKGIG